MKRMVYAVLVISACLVAASCSKGGGRPSDVFTRVQGITGDSLDAMAPFYTRGSMEALRELMSLVPDDMKKKDNTFGQGAKWEVVEEKVEGDTATVRLRFTEHPSAQVKGTEMPFRVKREDGAWKIDIEQETRLGLEMFRKMRENPEIMKMMRKFQKQ